MAEYWKSTPKYWCKFCETFVKDTKFERQQHEATGRHKGAIQRNLRQLHQGREREEREKQRAKDEVARLNAIVSGTPSSSSSKPEASKSVYASSTPAKATLSDRKRQMEQLAAMGVQVPDAFRGDLAMAGEWTTISQTIVRDEEEEKGEPVALDGTDRKRKHEGEEEEKPIYRRKVLGQRTYPGSKDEGEDLDALLSRIAPKKEPDQPEGKSEIVDADETVIKEEPQDGSPDIANSETPIKMEEPAKPEEDRPGAGIVFKKRKKPLRPT